MSVFTTTDPVQGQAFAFSSVFWNLSTGNRLTGTLTGLAATISKDGGAFTATTNAPVEIGTSGVVTLSLSTTEMTATLIIAILTSSTANAQDCIVEIRPRDMAEHAGAALDQSILKPEQVLLDVAAAAINLNTLSNGTYTIYKRDATAKLSGTYTQGTETAQRGKLV